MAVVDRWSALRERTADRTIQASSGGAPVAMWALVIAGVAIAYGLTYVAGGSKTSLPHAFYVPVIVAAVRFGRRGALAAAVGAGTLAGPLMPLDVSEGAPQEMANWLPRLGFFALVGVLTAYLCRHSLPSLAGELGARRFRRELSEALTQGSVHPVYQPVIDLRDGSVAGVEALVRWEHPDRGPLSPADFILEAERSGCIGDLTGFMLGRVCAQVAEWRDGPLRGTADFRISVNISGADLSDPCFAAVVEKALELSGIPNRWLHLEITETALIDDPHVAADSLMHLRMLGVRLAIDDFGTGESSLGHLDRFPVDVLKVDRSFLQRNRDDRATDPLTAGVVALGHAMDMVVIAEGVETDAHLRIVLQCGYDYAQGYFFSPPIGAAEIEALLRSPAPFGGARWG